VDARERRSRNEHTRESQSGDDAIHVYILAFDLALVCVRFGWSLLQRQCQRRKWAKPALFAFYSIDFPVICGAP
jgi:hypothetical protein